MTDERTPGGFRAEQERTPPGLHAPLHLTALHGTTEHGTESSGHPIHPTSSTSTRETATVDGQQPDDAHWPRALVTAAAIYACIDAGHDVGLKHRGGHLDTATCHDCHHAFDRYWSPAEHDQPSRPVVAVGVCGVPDEAVAVWFYFSDADPVAECECGWRTVGDAAVDAFRAWWKHRASHDEIARPVIDPPTAPTPESDAS